MLQQSAVERLRQGEWLQAVPLAFRDALLRACVIRRFRRGEILCGIGEDTIGLIGIASGQVRVEVAPYERGPHPGLQLHEGAWTGAASVIANRPHMVEVVATRDGVAAQISAGAIGEICAVQPMGWRWIALLTVLNLREVIGIADDLLLRAPRARLAALLLRQAGVRQRDEPARPAPELDLTQSDLAALANLSRASAAHMLAEMESSRLIARGYGMIVLCDTHALRKIANHEP